MNNEGAPPRVIDGRFELVKRLGGGGMGTVWRAHDQILHRDVAVKEVRPPDAALAEYDPEAARTLRERVLREARALARIDHPNVVTIHHIVDAGPGTYPWIVMELVPGGSLQDRLAEGPLAVADAARLGSGILSALGAAHAAGIEHRDVKPANVLLRPDGRPVLTDFGIAAVRESTSLTATGAVIGSPDYMAPERISGAEGGPASDLWSLAMLLYVAVEGHHPLRRASTLATLAAVLSEDVPPPQKAGPLTGLLTALLVRDPATRPDAAAVDRMLTEAAVTSTHQQAPAPVPPAPPAAQDITPSEPSSSPSVGTPTPPPRPTHTSYHLAPPEDRVPDGVPHGAPDITPPPPPPGTATTAGAGFTGARSQARRARATTIAASLLGTALTGVLVWTLLPAPDDNSNSGSPGSSTGPSTSPSPSGRTTTAPPNDKSDDTPEDTTDGKKKDQGSKEDFLSPVGLRHVIKQLATVMDTTRVTSFSIYDTHVSADAVIKGSNNRYDRYVYRAEAGATRDGAGGTLIGGVSPVDLADFDWDALPALFETADLTLNVSKPTARYILMNQALELIRSQPTLSIYVADDYGAGYLVADTKGKVIETHPQDG
ncbi:serine/threonine-protein kinase [Streptomyces sp. NPDC058001]|uniref:serine/threonine-protein kinase n=1 Tax=Streptomyces sp. NPDC058001 TaxID=3346300 RepID=UPI0036E5C4B9